MGDRAIRKAHEKGREKGLREGGSEGGGVPPMAPPTFIAKSRVDPISGALETDLISIISSSISERFDSALTAFTLADFTRLELRKITKRMTIRIPTSAE